MIRGIHHVALHTADLDRMIGFYRDVVGFEVVHEGDWADNAVTDAIIGVPGSAARYAMLRAGTCYLEIFQYSRPKARPDDPLRPSDHGYTHLCLDVVGIAEEYARLSANGMTFEAPFADFGDIKAVYGRDPDGNVVEIQETTPQQTFSLARLGRTFPQ